MVVEAGPDASKVGDPQRRFLQKTRRVISGGVIRGGLGQEEKINRFRALAILSSDALSSVAYGTEASLAVLIAAGAAALTVNLWLGLVIAALMIIVANSYRQTVYAYPSGGGSYTVARANLGKLPGLVAAASLLVDYLLTVAVSVAAGVDALISAFPELTGGRVALDLAFIVLIVLVNLRGVREAGNIFAVPTYFFLASFGLMVIVAIGRAFIEGGPFAAITPPAPPSTGSLSVLLVLTAFASGCSAMTGIEAISNSVPIFQGQTKAEQSKNAARTLMTMITILVVLFLSTTYLAWRVGAVPFASGQPTVTAQITQFAFQGTAFSWFFYVVQVATLLILIFAANTSFAGFPRLAAILAKDGFLPKIFTYRGERLAFNTGVYALGILSTVVIVAFAGRVTELINLYALGVFLSFTLSQVGMVRHWRDLRDTEPKWRSRLIANGVGAFATGLVSIVIAVAKFDRGAWVVVIIIPLLVMSFTRLEHYYHRPHIFKPDPPNVAQADVAFLPVLSLADADQEVKIASKLAKHLIVIYLLRDASEVEDFEHEWQNSPASRVPTEDGTPQLKIIVSPERTVVLPLTHFLVWHRRNTYKDQKMMVIFPDRIKSAWWEWPLHRKVFPRLHDALKIEPGSNGIIYVKLPFELGRN